MSLSEWLKEKLVVYVFQPLLNSYRPRRPWRRLGAARGWRTEDRERRVVIRFANGNLIIQAPADGVISLLASFDAADPADGYLTYAVLPSPGRPLTVTTEGACLLIGAGADQPCLRVDTTSGRILAEYDGVVLFREAAPAAAGPWHGCTLETPRPVRWLGCGQKTGGLFKNGHRYRMWNTDNSDMRKNSDPLYQSCPWVLALEEDGRAWGVFFDNPHYGDLCLSRRGGPGRLRSRSRRGPLALYLAAGPTLTLAVRQFTALTGRYHLPPLWVLGHHHSRWEPDESAARLAGIVREFRRRALPLDALHIDIGYMRGYRCFTWDRQRFPDPDAFLDDLRAHNVQPVVITDPGLKRDDDWDVYAGGLSRDVFLKDRRGRVFHAPVWPGPAAFPDFANAAAAEWWGRLFETHTRRGVAGFWIDMNEPSTFTPRRTLPDRLLHRVTAAHGEKIHDHAALHNYYGWLMARATASGLNNLRPGQRSFLFTRSSYAGIQRFASSWTGDNRSDWDHLRLALPMVMNMGLSGQCLTGPDLGGFRGAPSRELFIRFIQAGTLLPFHRNHTAAGTPPQEIWEFGAEAERICAHHVRLRYALLPYLYTSLRRSTVTGDPLCRPLCYEFPEDPACARSETADTHYLCGPALLAAPVLGPGERKRRVHFPAGAAWVGWWTHALHSGGRDEWVDAPLERLPLFVRRGSVLPTLSSAPGEFVSTADYFSQTLSLDVYPDVAFNGELYIDDGTGFAYREGLYSMITVTGRDTEHTITLTVERTEGRLEKPFHAFSRVQLRIAGCGKQRIPIKTSLNLRDIDAAAVERRGDWLKLVLPTDELPLHLTMEYMIEPGSGKHGSPAPFR